MIRLGMGHIIKCMWGILMSGFDKKLRELDTHMVLKRCVAEYKDCGVFTVGPFPTRLFERVKVR